MASKGSSRWGSLLSGAVSGLESRLDTILGEDADASARSRAAEKAAQDAKAATLAAPVSDSTDTSRNTSRSRVNDRLNERLAKALATPRSSSQAPSDTPSRTGSPLVGGASPRTSLGSRPSVEVSSSAREDTEPVQRELHPDGEGGTAVEDSSLLSSDLPINPARISNDGDSRPSLDLGDEAPAAAETDADTEETTVTRRTYEELETEMNQMRTDHAEAEKQRQEDMHANLERIDALQAKLTYLAKETVAAAKEANASPHSTSLDQKIAEKDERIALLMEEGEKLSKIEMRHLATIRKLRAKAIEDERAAAETKKKLSKIEDSEANLKQQAKHTEQVQRQHTERLKRIPELEKSVDASRNELQTSKSTIALLRKQLADAEKRAEEAETNVRESAVKADSGKISDLQDQLEDARLEKKLADDRANAEIRRLGEEAERQTQRASSRETEFKGEISNLESHIEALRSRAEEATSDVGGDAQAKLLRQIETLQTQYSLAAENWRSIESSLNSRVAAIEKERDEAIKREADVRKKARDISSKSKRVEEDLDEAAETSRNLSQELQSQTNEMKKLQARLDLSEKAITEAKSDFERQKRAWDSEFAQKLEDEKARLIQQGFGLNTHAQSPGELISRTQSPTSYFRKASTQDPLHSIQSRRNLHRMPSSDHNGLSIDRLTSRRASALNTPVLSTSRVSATPEYPSPGFSRQSSSFSLSQLNGGMPPTPSVHAHDVDADEAFDNRSSPQHTIADVISASTVHTGPSVQLVERMSSSIRRLESEKAAHRDELARIVSQRDDARNEVVALMRELDAKSQADGRRDGIEAELAEVRKRYDACLEMLGEREEEVDELKGDVADLKRIYKELVDRSMK
ncbi:hypothetical protein MBLNU459_g1380t1 [Dothideomycetes sp. NU459]